MMQADGDKRKGRSTLSEVATRAGVSTTTASLVLAGKAQKLRIADDTLRRVQQAAKDLNYAPNLLLRSLRRGRTQIISFYNAFRHREQYDAYMDRLATAVEYACGQRGYDALVHCNFQRRAEETYKFLNGGFADGVLLFAPLPDDPLLPYLRSAGVPTVLINARDREGVLHSVKDDADEGLRLVANALLEAGHTRIAVLSEDGPDYRDARHRVQLLQIELAAAGYPVPPERLINVGGHQEAALERLLSLDPRPTAVFAWHDSLAYEILALCEAKGIQVPEELALVGYDGVQWPKATRHQAAGVMVDLYQLAIQSVNLLDEVIEGRVDDLQERTLSVSFDYGTTLRPRTSSIQ